MQNRPNIFFRLALGTGVLFVVTVLALTAAIFGDPRAPSARFLDNHGGALIAAEVAATLIFAFWAMALDRRRQVREAGSDGGGERVSETDPDGESRLAQNEYEDDRDERAKERRNNN